MMRQTSRALSRALSPKRSQRPAHPTSGDDDSDATGAAAAAAAAATGGSPASSPSFISLTGRAGSRSRYRPRRRRSAAAAAAEMPELEKSEEEFRRDWGITREREEILLTEFRTQLEAVTGGPLKPVFDRYYLRRFLRARQHDLPRAKAMFMAHLKWRADNGVDTILEDFHFQERDAFLALYPQGYHKTDKMGRPIYIQHIGAIKIKQLAEITNDDRMVRYHIQEYERCLKYIFPCCSKKAGRHIDQTFAIMDVKGVGLKHLTGDVKTILGRITETDQNNYPETLGKTVIINAPTVFKMVWAVVRPMLDVRTQAKIEVAPSDYMKVLLEHIDPDCIPEYLGGTSKGSLIDDVGPWSEPAILARVEADIARRERGSTAGEGDEGVLSGDSMDLEGAGSTRAMPSPTAQSAQGERERQQQQQDVQAGDAAQLSGRSSSAGESPFSKYGTGSFAHPMPLTDSEVDEFQDARSRRQSILSSGSSAYMSGGDDDAEYYTPKHADQPPVSGSGFSFHSDRPLLNASGPTSPDGKMLPAAGGGDASPPPPSAQQQQQASPFRYSDQYPPSSPEQQGAAAAAAASIQAARGGGQRPTLRVVLPSASGERQTSSEGGPEVSLNGGLAVSQAQTAYGTPGSVSWSPSKQAGLAEGVPSPPLQIPILARVRALEEKLPEAERHVRRYLPPGGELPSKAVGQGTLLHRVEALERAMDTLLRAQDTALDQQRQQRQQRQRSGSGSEASGRGCSGCCCVM